MKFNDELTLFLKARYPIIYINTIEEDRIEYVIRKNIKTNLNRSIYRHISIGEAIIIGQYHLHKKWIFLK